MIQQIQSFLSLAEGILPIIGWETLIWGSLNLNLSWFHYFSCEQQLTGKSKGVAFFRKYRNNLGFNLSIQIDSVL